jgi:hypothetical protein
MYVPDLNFRPVMTFLKGDIWSMEDRELRTEEELKLA